MLVISVCFLFASVSSLPAETVNLTFNASLDDTNPPDEPVIRGFSKAKKDVEYEYRIISTDPEGSSIYYHIEVSGPTNSREEKGPFQSGKEIQIFLSFEKTGQYTISVKAEDEFSNENPNPALFDVTVTLTDPNPPYTPTVTGALKGSVRESYECEFYTIDPEGSDVFYHIEIICLSPDIRMNENIGPYPSGMRVNRSYKLKQDGDYIIAAMTRDEHGNVNTCWGSIRVTIPKSKLFIKNANTPPDKPSKPYVENRPDPIGNPLARNNNYTFCTRTEDSDGDKIKYGWNWTGQIDDNPLTVDEWEDNNGIFYEKYLTIHTLHGYKKAGTYHVCVIACDEYGLESEWSDPLHIFVSQNKAPVVFDYVGDQVVQVGKEAEKGYFLSVIDPEHEGVYCYFDWGDGSNTGWLEEEVRSANHVWTEKGTYSVRAKAKDIYDAETSWYYLEVNVVKKKSKTFLFNLFEDYPIVSHFFQILHKLKQN